MVDVVDHEVFELVLVPDDGAVEELASQGADPAFDEGVGYRGLNRSLENLEALAIEDLVEVVDELAGAVSQKCSGVGEAVGVTHEEVAGGLGGPCAGRVGGDAAVEQLAVCDVDEERHVAAAQQGGVDGREVTGNGGLGAQELSLNPPTGLWDRRLGAGWPLGWCVCAGRRVLGRAGLECGAGAVGGG